MATFATLPHVPSFAVAPRGCSLSDRWCYSSATGSRFLPNQCRWNQEHPRRRRGRRSAQGGRCLEQLALRLQSRRATTVLTSHRRNPYMNYGRSKMLMEQAVQAANRSGRLETVIVRPPWFYGPYQPPRQSFFFRMIKDGKAPIVGDGNNLRSMAYIDNLGQGLDPCRGNPVAAGQTYWVADERPYTMNEIVDTVEEITRDGIRHPMRRHGGSDFPRSPAK